MNWLKENVHMSCWIYHENIDREKGREKNGEVFGLTEWKCGSHINKNVNNEFDKVEMDDGQQDFDKYREKIHYILYNVNNVAWLRDKIWAGLMKENHILHICDSWEGFETRKCSKWSDTREYKII